MSRIIRVEPYTRNITHRSLARGKVSDKDMLADRLDVSAVDATTTHVAARAAPPPLR